MLVGLLTQETTTFDGRYYQLNDARNEPKGPQQPHPPICIGGSGEKRTLRTAARYAEHWNFVGGPPEEFARKRDVLYAHCAEIGRDPSEITTVGASRLGPNGIPAWWPTRPRSARWDSISRSSICRRRTNPQYWNRWLARSRRWRNSARRRRRVAGETEPSDRRLNKCCSAHPYPSIWVTERLRLVRAD